VTAYFEGVFAEVDALRLRLAEVCAGGDVTAATVSEAALPLTRDMLSRLPLYGGGFVAAPGFLSDQHLYLAWWQGDDRQLLAQAAVPSFGDPVDYSRLEWYRGPATTGRRHVTGPYVDFVCCDEYILTATVPVVVDGRTVGVVGADTLLETFESLMLPAVRSAGATLVNGYHRVVVSADPRIPTGRLVDPDDYAVSAPCGDLPLVVLASGGSS
jgi:hypothetical protein